MTEEKKDLIINGHEPIIIDPREYPSTHAIIIGKCGTAGHKTIIKEIFTEEVKKRSEEMLKVRSE